MTKSKNPNTNVVSAGVIFAEGASYFCLPLDSLGIDSSKEIKSMKSSCECAQPRLVLFKRRGEVIHGLKIDFLPSADEQADPVELRVDIELAFVDGTKENISVDLLHTSQVR